MDNKLNSNYENENKFTEEKEDEVDLMNSRLKYKKNLKINSNYNTLSYNSNLNTATSKNNNYRSIVDSKILTTSTFRNTSGKGFGSSVYQSSNTLQNSIVSWTFPKTDRFKHFYKKPLNDSLYNTVRTENTRYTSQGYGKRYDIISPQAKISPPPNRYKIISELEKNLRERKGYSMTFKPKEVPSDAEKHVPGPGNYQVREVALSKKLPVAIKSHEDVKQKEHCISPQTYLPNTKLTENLRFSQVMFGVGGRSPNENTFVKGFPGPGSYNLPSVFDKKRRIRVPLN